MVCIYVSLYTIMFYAHHICLQWNIRWQCATKHWTNSIHKHRSSLIDRYFWLSLNIRCKYQVSKYVCYTITNSTTITTNTNQHQPLPPSRQCTCSDQGMHDSHHRNWNTSIRNICINDAISLIFVRKSYIGSFHLKRVLFMHILLHKIHRKPNYHT